MSEPSREDLIELLAAVEHEQWARWSQDIAISENISETRFRRWQSLWVPYDLLQEDQKQSDREWAERVYNILVQTGILNLTPSPPTTTTTKTKLRSLVSQSEPGGS